MNELSINQEKWPAVGRYIGEQNPPEDCDLLDMPVNGESGECFMYQRNCRVYGDEIPLAKSRIDLVNNLQYCYVEGYNKDISWKN